jgi:hypothetical protein
MGPALASRLRGYQSPSTGGTQVITSDASRNAWLFGDPLAITCNAQPRLSAITLVCRRTHPVREESLSVTEHGPARSGPYEKCQQTGASPKSVACSWVSDGTCYLVLPNDEQARMIVVRGRCEAFELFNQQIDPRASRLCDSLKAE